MALSRGGRPPADRTAKTVNNARRADLRGFRLLLGRGKRAPYLGLLGAWASPRYREMQHRGGDIGDHETWGSERYFSALNDPAILTYYPPRSSNFPST